MNLSVQILTIALPTVPTLIVLAFFACLALSGGVYFLWKRGRYQPLLNESVRTTFDAVSAQHLNDALQDALAHSVSSNTSVALALIDVDRFKEVIRLYGHDNASEVIVGAMERLRGSLRNDDLLLRLATDEFAVVRPGASSLEEVRQLGETLLDCLTAPFLLDGYRLTLLANVGLVMEEGDEASPSSLYELAEAALFRASIRGANNIEIANLASGSQVSPSKVAAWLAEALQERHLKLHYQPILSVQSSTKSTMLGVEALLRWEHPIHGPIAPEVVFPALEATGMIEVVGHWVLEECCRQLAIWRDTGRQGRNFLVFVNVSTRQLEAVNFVAELERLIAGAEIEAHQLCFELGGLGAVPEHSPVWAVLRECKALGVRLAIDRFGENSSSFGMFRRLRCDYLKLDRGLVSARLATPHDDAIARAIVAMAKELGCQTIAEGVEEAASHERARVLGCQFVQGYLPGMPDDPERISEALSSERNAVTEAEVPQYSAPQYGAPQYSAPPYGAPQYGAPLDGTPPDHTSEPTVSARYEPAQSMPYRPRIEPVSGA